MSKRLISYLLCFLLLFCPGITACVNSDIQSGSCANDLNEVSDFSGSPYEEINGNVPEFDEDDYTTKPFEVYSELDSLGRCGVAFANICKEIMPAEKRGGIGMIKPSGWHTIKYDFIDGLYLYNRCHLIGYQLSGENANEDNLITGTRYMNIQGMLPFENMVDDYVDETDNHVLYRVTPVYEDDNLVASGVQMEGWSVEDEGEGICYNVFVYNSQPGIEIDYKTGESSISGETETENETENVYVLNNNTKRIHRPDCASVSNILPENKEVTHEDRETLISYGYIPCGRCNP